MGDTQRDGKSIGSAWRHAQPSACVRGKSGGPDLNRVSTGGQVGHGEMTVRIRDGFLDRASDFVLDYDRGGRKGFAGLVEDGSGYGCGVLLRVQQSGAAAGRTANTAIEIRRRSWFEQSCI